LTDSLAENTEETSDTCPGGGPQFFQDLDGSGEVVVSDAIVCTAGDSLLVFDVGYMNPDGTFVLVTQSAVSVSISVAPGKSAVIKLFSANATRELSFTHLSTLVYVRFLDKGYNVSSHASCCWIQRVQLTVLFRWSMAAIKWRCFLSIPPHLRLLRQKPLT
jgi:hypothetical protein